MVLIAQQTHLGKTDILKLIFFEMSSGKSNHFNSFDLNFFLCSNPNCLRQLSADAITTAQVTTEVNSPSSSHANSVTQNDSSRPMHGQSPNATNGQASQQQQQKSIGGMVSEFSSLDLVSIIVAVNKRNFRYNYN